MSQEDIDNENRIISNLRVQLKNISMPRRTISWQHQNRGFASRNITQKRLIVRKQKRQINDKIFQSESRISSLRKSLFGVE